MKKLILLTVLIQFQLSLIGQEKQKLIVQIYPSNSYVNINDTIIDANKERGLFDLDLIPGTYPIEIWSSRFSLFKDTIVVKDPINHYTKGLAQQSPLFKEFKMETKKYKRKRNGRYAATGGILLANIAGFWYTIEGGSTKKINELQDRAQTLRELHLNRGSDLVLMNNRLRYEMIQSDFETKRKNLYLKRSIGIPLVTLTSIFSGIYLKRMWSKKLIAPIFEGEKNPFVLRNIEVEASELSYNLNLKFEF